MVDLATFEQKLVPGHHDVIMELSVTYPYFAASSKDNTIRLFEFKEGADFQAHSVQCLAVLKGHTQSVTSIALAHKSPPSFLMSVSEDKTVKRWELPAGVYKGKKTVLIK